MPYILATFSVYSQHFVLTFISGLERVQDTSFSTASRLLLNFIKVGQTNAFLWCLCNYPGQNEKIPRFQPCFSCQIVYTIEQIPFARVLVKHF